jgi:dihydroorotate dehydrogenase (fumarate)
MFTESTAGSHPEAASYFPELPDYRYGVSGHLETLQRATEAPDIPMIASLNGISDDGWLDYAVEPEQAALPRNLYLLPTDLAVRGMDIEHRYLDIVRHVKAEVRIPVSVKAPAVF